MAIKLNLPKGYKEEVQVLKRTEWEKLVIQGRAEKITIGRVTRFILK